MKKVIYIIALLIGATTMAQTITVNGTPMLVSDDISFPFWLESGSSISPEVPVSSISVLEFNIVPNNNGNDMVFNQVISVTEGQTVPEGKTWKVESILMENYSSFQSSINTSSYFAQNNPSQSMSVEEPFYDSLNTCWIINANFLPTGGTDVLEKGFCYSSSNSSPNVSDNFTSSGSGKNDFFAAFNVGNQFEPNTTYYLRAYASKIDGVYYSAVFTINTDEVIAPQIGDYVYGGVVFYIDDTGEHGMIISEHDSDLPGLYEWGCEGEDILFGDQFLFGIGRDNTYNIIAACSSNSAALACSNFSNGVYSDWYLPAYDELQTAKSNLYPPIEFSTGIQYWTSSEYNNDDAIAINFNNGNFQYITKSTKLKVRPIREF
jgi:hypothetical protein